MKKPEAAFPAREVRKTASGLANSYVGRPTRQQAPAKAGGSDSEDDRRLEARVKAKTFFSHDDTSSDVFIFQR